MSEKENTTSADQAVEQSGDFVPATPDLNPRTQAMAEIAKRSNADRLREAGETAPTLDEDNRPTSEAAPEKEQTLEEAGASADAAAAAAEQAAPNATEGSSPDVVPAAAAAPSESAIDPTADYDIVVEGQKIKVKGAKIIERGRATLQKETAAEYKLELATKALQEAEQIRNSARQVPQAAAPLPAQGAPAKPAEPSDAELASLIQFGTQEQAAEAIKRLRARDSSTLTVEGMQQFMTRALPQVVDAQLAFREAATFARTEYGDLLNDPYLKELFFLKEDQLRRAGDKRPYRDLYKAIGDDIRVHFNKPAPQASTPAPTRQERTEAKAKAPAVPKLAATRLEGGADTQKPKTREEIIESMRRSRGQDSINRF